MNLEKIKSIIQNYKELYELVVNKIELLETIDSSIYDTKRGIDNISYDNDTVYVICDDPYSGCIDHHYFEFPIEWLLKQDDELEELIKKEKKLREEKERLREEEENEKMIKEKEERDRIKYEMLKKKFESK